MIPVFIGYDPREAVAWSVLAHSIQVRSSVPVAIAPLALAQLREVLVRARHPLQSTDFAFSRFLVPYLSRYSGWSVFLDCDMLALDDIANLWALRDERYAVQVVKHDHRPREKTKFLGEPQTAYEKKNWSSVMLFNNGKCRALTPEYVNRAGGLDLHQFEWLESEALIGALPGRWNHLVGCSAPSREVSLVHYTLGGPYFPEFADCEYADEWRAEREAMLFAGCK
ncbi:MAG: glycosyltransferase [Betaproteobacteria bacterium]|nr:glycosyltransferase [Betaproteobacteria bacterium]